MNINPRKRLMFFGLLFALWGLPACKATQLTAVTKDPAYDPRGMRSVFVVAVVKTERVQKMLEDEFVRQLSSQGRQAVASYTRIPHDNKLGPDAWKSLIKENGWDTVIISRLVDMKEVEKDVGSKVITRGDAGSNYYEYGSYASSTYQPASYVREQTAMIETKVFDVASGKEVWSAHSKTEITWGGDPVPQIRTFVNTLMKEASRARS